MKNFIFSALLALGIAGCAVSTAPTPAGNLSSLKSEIVNYTRQSSTAYVYTFKDLSSGELYTARTSRYYAAAGDTAYISTASGAITDMRIISRKAGSVAPRAYDIGKIETKQMHKNDAIAVPESENISF